MRSSIFKYLYANHVVTWIGILVFWGFRAWSEQSSKGAYSLIQSVEPSQGADESMLFSSSLLIIAALGAFQLRKLIGSNPYMRRESIFEKVDKS